MEKTRKGEPLPQKKVQEQRSLNLEEWCREQERRRACLDPRLELDRDGQ